MGIERETRPQDEQHTGNGAGGPQGQEDIQPFRLTRWNPWDRSGGPAFPFEMLPPLAADWVETKAMQTGADPSAFAMAHLQIISGLTNHQMRLQPKQYETDFLITPAIWAVLVGHPSTLKSAVVRAVVSFLRRFDKQDAKTRELQVRALQEEDPNADDHVPAARRRLLVDPTVEAAATILSEQTCGATLVRDELAGWLNNMDRYNKGSDRPFWLQAFDGSYYASERVDKKLRRTVEMLSIGIFGGIQPEKLTSIPGLTIDGLFQRFLPITMQPSASEADDPVDFDLQARYDVLTERLNGLTPQTVTMTHDASLLYMKFSNEMRQASRTMIPNEAFGTFLGKQGRTLGAISLLLHICDAALASRLSLTPVPVETMLRAQAIIERFILPHAESFYASSFVNAGVDKVLSIGGAVIKLANEGTDAISARELGRRSRAIRELQSDIGKIRQVLTPFVVNGWLTPTNLLPTNNNWKIHPDLAGRFKAEIAAQAAINAQMKQRMGSVAAETDE